MRVINVPSKEKTCYLKQATDTRVELHINGVYVADITDSRFTIEKKSLDNTGLEYYVL